MQLTELKLNERVKELACLYELSRIAWQVDKDVHTLLSKTIKILPGAMQHPSLAEARITLGEEIFATPRFRDCKVRISVFLIPNQKKSGKLEVGYRVSAAKGRQSIFFLPEERKLINTVARELSLFIRRNTAEEEKQRLQIQLQHAERLAFVGELTAGIAHELNEPLGRVLGFAQLIKKGGGLSEQQNEDLERIIKASLYTREVIKKLMIFSRQMPRQIIKVNLNEIVGSILYFIDTRFESKSIKITQRLDPQLPLIEADVVQMSQVLVNLITNAIHSLQGGGDIIIETKKKTHGVSIIVKDTGHGMPVEVKKRIFEPFYTTKPVGQGTGLGLSVVLGIIEGHGGKIAVTSAPGKGSKFEVALPLTQHRNKKTS
jgi:signal transduction histidine kinase